ncbi:MAG: PilZ domain-containing protein [Thermodesulfobacteriota bacterium]
MSSSKYPNEKRKEARAEFYPLVALRSGKTEILPKSRAQDISMTGIFINTEKTLPVGKDCDVQIYLKGKSSILMLIIKGKVVRSSQAGIGITFKKLDVDTYFLLNAILNNAVLDPTTIINEIFPFE